MDGGRSGGHVSFIHAELHPLRLRLTEPVVITHNGPQSVHRQQAAARVQSTRDEKGTRTAA